MRQRLVPSALAVLGLGLAATGVAAVFMAESDTGAAALLTIGVILVLFAAVGDRLESLRYGDFELVLRRKADEAARRGDIVEAKALREAETNADRPDIDQEEVLSLLWTGSEGARVWALGVLKGRPDLATTRAVLEAVQRPDQMFDQFHALLLAERFVSLSDTRTWARERIAAAVRAQLESGALGTDHDSIEAAERVLHQVNKRTNN